MSFEFFLTIEALHIKHILFDSAHLNLWISLVLETRFNNCLDFWQTTLQTVTIPKIEVLTQVDLTIDNLHNCLFYVFGLKIERYIFNC